ncbi:putative membrane protein [Loktanella ponticola]|uniref:Putative membrane protein n=1 Tax=Yoonia ponticola TaxID=1524255 RepID=A0A7W9EZ17_9RHOB|nr:DUF2306 domain-containing protein [Yoonia ponticola]MBB5723337.1 putative membrane protein [Yoonia ponticola]
MTFGPLLFAPFAIQVHVVCALAAIVLGPVTLWRRSRDIWHRTAGYIWVIAMAITAISSFWISDTPMIGPFGPIHVLSVVTLTGLLRGINAARAGRTTAHQRTMKSLYFWAMGVAGVFTFLPERRMNDVFFSGHPLLGFIAMAVLIAGGLCLYWITERRRAI